MVFLTKSEYLGSIFVIDIKITKVGIRNLSPHLRNIADNQIDCGIAD